MTDTNSVPAEHVPRGERDVRRVRPGQPDVRSELVAQWAKAVNLCGMVTRIPSTFREP
jgi:hypothetical protein